VTTGYQTAPTFSQSQLQFNAQPIPISISGNPTQDLDFQEPDFLKPTHANALGGSSASSSDSITAPTVEAGAGNGYFPAHLNRERDFSRYQSSPNPTFSQSQTYGFQTSNQTLASAKAHWTSEQEKLESLVRRLKPKVRGELRGMAEVFVPGQEDVDASGMHEDGDEVRAGKVDEFGFSRGTKRAGGRHARSASGENMFGSGVDGNQSDDGMASGTDTDEPPQPQSHSHSHAVANESDFGTPAFMRSAKSRGLRPTKSLPARSFAFGGPSSLNPADAGPMAAPFTSGFFSPNVSTADFSARGTSPPLGMEVEGSGTEEEGEDGFDMDEAFGGEGDVFGSTIGGSMDTGASSVPQGETQGGLGEWTNRTDF
jgi:hypothetical protein